MFGPIYTLLIQHTDTTIAIFRILLIQGKTKGRNIIEQVEHALNFEISTERMAIFTVHALTTLAIANVVVQVHQEVLRTRLVGQF